MITARRITLAILIVGIGFAGFRLSFSAQYELVTRIAHIDATIAWLYPLLVDAFIITTSLSALWVEQSTRWLRAYPWIAMALFSAISITGNALTVLTVRNIEQPALAVAIYSVPPIGLLIATHLATTTVFRPRARQAPALTRPAKRHPRSRQVLVSTALASTREDIPEPTAAELLAMSEQGMSMAQIAVAVGRSKSWVGKNVKEERERVLGDTPQLQSVNTGDA